MTWYADLHAHSTFSDGTLTPEALVALAASRGVRALALTDHDTIAGYPEAAVAGAKQGVEIVCGVEITVWHTRELHLLAYFVDPADAALNDLLVRRAQARRERVREIAARLAQLGAPIDPDAILAACRDGNVGRPHVARALVAAGHCATIDEAFDRYLGRDGRAYVTATHLPIEDAIHTAHAAGGVVSLAHPGIEKVDDAVPALAELGLDALEAHHPAHSYAETARYIGMCQLLGLQTTGGADFHGHPGSAPPGAFGISSEGLAALRARRRSGPAPAAVLGSAP